MWSKEVRAVGNAVSSNMNPMKPISCWARYLVEDEGVDVNRRDMWDAVPLYYSCLAGHPEVAAYLLEQGAGRCLPACLIPRLSWPLTSAGTADVNHRLCPIRGAPHNPLMKRVAPCSEGFAEACPLA